MDVIFGLLGIVFIVGILLGLFFLIIAMARKIGLIKPLVADGELAEGSVATSNYSGGVGIPQFDMSKATDSLLFRFLIISILIVLMSLPLNMVKDIVGERSRLYHKVLNEISATWGHQQNLRGPSLFIPYTEKYITEEIKTDNDGNERTVNKTIYKQRTAIILPNDLKIDVDLDGESRKRSIYEALVYTADVKVSGDFKKPEISGLSNYISEIHWDKAWLALGISDTQAINKVSYLNWDNTEKVDFEPGTKVVKLLPSGFHAPLDLSKQQDAESKIIPFSLSLNINGSRGFYFSPFGKTTNVTIDSDWPHPSFQGNVLPNNHDVNAEGFNANWSIPHLARNYPQIWTLETQNFNVGEFSAGVNLFESVSLYSQVTRAIKYGLLFFILTYITFLIFELGIGRRLHIVQYGVIGLALSMFYLTLLSMAEHSGFFKAYVSAASIIIVMVSMYAFSAIKSLGRTVVITLLLTGLYCLLYSLLQLEDYALLAGTALLLLILAVLMFLTRNIGNE